MKMAPRVSAPVVPSIQDTEDDIQEVEAEVKTEPGASGVMEQYQEAHDMAGAASYEEGYEYGDFGEQESYVMDTADQEKGETKIYYDEILQIVIMLRLQLSFCFGKCPFVLLWSDLS